MSLAIMSALLTAFVPNFERFILHSKLISTHNYVSAIVQAARLYAFTENRTILVCGFSEATGQCDGDYWHKHILVFADNNNNAAYDNDEHVINQFHPSSANVTIKSTRRFARFLPDGGVSTPLSIKFCIDSDSSIPLARAIYISLQGRLRSRHSDNFNNGQDTDVANAINC